MVMPDADTAGEGYAEDVVERLLKLDPPAQVKVLRLPGLQNGEDLVEFADTLAATGSLNEAIADEVRALAAAAPLSQVKQPAPQETPPVKGAVPEQALRAYEPFPVDVLPPPARDLVARGAKAIGCDPAFIALPALAVMAGAIGNSRVIEVKDGWCEPSVVWAVIVGKSGSQKSPALDLAADPLHALSRAQLGDHERDLDEYFRATEDYEAALAKWRRDGAFGERPEKPTEPACQRLLTQDATVEALAALLRVSPFGMTLVNDELSGWFGSLDAYKATKGADMAHYLTMFGARPMTVDRKGSKTGPIVVPRATLSIIGGIQPGVLNRMLGSEHRESGAFARFLVAAPPQRTKRWTDAGVPVGIRQRWHDLVESLVGLRREVPLEPEVQPSVVRLSAGAKQVWIAFYNEHAEAMREREGEAAAAFAKLESYAVRIALVFHMADVVLGIVGDHETVSEPCMVRAVRLVLWARGEVERVQAVLAEDEQAEELRRVLDLVVEVGGRLTPRELMRKTRRYRDKVQDAVEVLDALVEMGALVRGLTKPGASGGRQSTYYCLPTAADSHAAGDTTTRHSVEAGLCHRHQGSSGVSEHGRWGPATDPLQSPADEEPNYVWSPAVLAVTVTQPRWEPWFGGFVTMAAARGPIAGHFGCGGVQ